MFVLDNSELVHRQPVVVVGGIEVDDADLFAPWIFPRLLRYSYVHAVHDHCGGRRGCGLPAWPLPDGSVFGKRQSSASSGRPELIRARAPRTADSNVTSSCVLRRDVGAGRHTRAAHYVITQPSKPVERGVFYDGFGQNGHGDQASGWKGGRVSMRVFSRVCGQNRRTILSTFRHTAAQYIKKGRQVRISAD